MKRMTKKKNIYLRAFLCIVIILSIIPCTPTQAAKTVKRTKADALAWADSMVGTKNLDADGVYPGECVDLILTYYDYLIGNHSGIRGNAKDYATNYVPDSFTRIKGATPQPGDICVNTKGDWGHVWIQGEGKTTYHQNWYYIKEVKKLSGWDNLTAEYVIRPNFKEETGPSVTKAPATPTPTSVPIVDTGKWEKTGSGTYYYCTEQDGFYSKHAIYNKYERTPLASSETSTQKRVVSDPEFYTYIYYHWTWSKYERSTYNLFVSDHYKWEGNYEYYNFRAFESSEEYGHTDKYGAYDPDVFYHWMNNPEDGSWWWFRVPVYKQTYTDYKLKATNTPKPTATNTPKPTATSTPKAVATSTPIPKATYTPLPTITSEPYYVGSYYNGNTNSYLSFTMEINAVVSSGQGTVCIKDLSPNATRRITEFTSSAFLLKEYDGEADLYYEIMLCAAPNTGYHFSHWEELVVENNYNTSNVIVSNSNNYTITGNAEPTQKNYFAVFVTNTPTPKPAATNTPKPTSTNTPKPTTTSTPKPTATSTPKPTATSTPKPTATATPKPTATSTPKPTATATPKPTATSTPKPEVTVSPTSTPTVTLTPTFTPVPTSTSTPTVEPTSTVTPTPVVTQAPTSTSKPSEANTLTTKEPAAETQAPAKKSEQEYNNGTSASVERYVVDGLAEKEDELTSEVEEKDTFTVEIPKPAVYTALGVLGGVAISTLLSQIIRRRRK